MPVTLEEFLPKYTINLKSLYCQPIFLMVELAVQSWPPVTLGYLSLYQGSEISC